MGSRQWDKDWTDPYNTTEKEIGPEAGRTVEEKQPKPPDPPDPPATDETEP